MPTGGSDRPRRGVAELDHKVSDLRCKTRIAHDGGVEIQLLREAMIVA